MPLCTIDNYVLKRKKLRGLEKYKCHEEVMVVVVIDVDGGKWGKGVGLGGSNGGERHG